MTQNDSTPIGQDKLQSAVKALSELVRKYPEKSRSEILHEIQLRYDLSPLDCEFLQRHFIKKQ